MFSLDLTLREPGSCKIVDESPKHAEFFVTKASLWKLLSPVFSHLTWDFPVLHPCRSNTILILAIPPDMSPDCLHAYVRANTPGEFKFTIINGMIRSVVLEFATQEGADVFYINSLGEPFEGKMRHLRCISLFLEQVVPESVGIAPIRTWQGDELNREIELPMCPICFVLFDQLTSTLFTFASLDDVGPDAFREWGSPACPACTARKDKCQSCDVKKKLWVCLECGHVGCGRDENQHAVSHFEKTGHRFAVRYDDHWIWDYVADRSGDRTFHDRPTEATDEVVGNYRKLLLERMAGQQKEEQEELAAMHKTLDPQLEALQKELEQVEAEEAALRQEVEKQQPLVRELKAIEDEIASLRICPAFTQQERLKNREKQLTEQLSELSVRGDTAYKRLVNTPSVNNVVIDKP